MEEWGEKIIRSGPEAGGKGRVTAAHNGARRFPQIESDEVTLKMGPGFGAPPPLNMESGGCRRLRTSFEGSSGPPPARELNPESQKHNKNCVYWATGGAERALKARSAAFGNCRAPYCAAVVPQAIAHLPFAAPGNHIPGSSRAPFCAAAMTVLSPVAPSGYAQSGNRQSLFRSFCLKHTVS